MSIAIRAQFEEVRRILFGAISGTFAGIGTSFEHPVRMLIIQNLTDDIMTFSHDGFTDHFDLAAGATLIMDMSSNKTIPQGFFFAEGSRMYVRQYDGAPTTGFVSMSVVYGTTGL